MTDLGRPSRSTPVAVAYLFGRYRLEPAKRAVWLADGTQVKLVGKPFDALVYLVEHAGQVVDRRTLLEVLWPKRIVEDNNVNQAIAVLRRVLGSDLIATVAGRGYQFVGNVRVAGDALPIADPQAPPAEAAAPQLTRPRWRGLAGAAVALAIAGGLLAAYPWQRAPKQLGTVESITPLTTYDGAETTPALSPDGTLVAFSWDGDGNRNIYVVQIGTGSRTRLTSSQEGADEFPAWSPDGRHIAFMRSYNAARFEIVLIPSLGGPERKVYSGERYWISREGSPLIAWTPDGKELWFTSRRPDSPDDLTYALQRLDLETGAVAPIFPADVHAENYDTSPAISRDGRWLSFTRFQRGHRLNAVMIQRLGPGFVPQGHPKEVPMSDPGVYHSLSWAPDGESLRFTNGSRLFEWTHGGPTRAIYTAGPQLTVASMSIGEFGGASRAAVVAVRPDVDVFALPVDPITHASVGPPAPRVRSTAVESHPRVAPDGKQLAFTSDRGGRSAVWLADIDGSDPLQLTDLDELVTGFPRWSPDGTRIAFHTSAANENRVIYVVDAAGGHPRRVANGCCPGGWARDGKHLYVHDIHGTSTVMRLDVDGGTLERLFEGDVATESADGEYLLYAKARERGYFRRSLRGDPGANPEERLVDDYIPANGGLVPLADGFFYVGFGTDDRPRAFRFYDYATRSARDVAPAPPIVGIGLSLSPDGTELFYAGATTPATDIALLEFGRAAP